MVAFNTVVQSTIGHLRSLKQVMTPVKAQRVNISFDFSKFHVLDDQLSYADELLNAELSKALVQKQVSLHFSVKGLSDASVMPIILDQVIEKLQEPKFSSLQIMNLDLKSLGNISPTDVEPLNALVNTGRVHTLLVNSDLSDGQLQQYAGMPLVRRLSR